MRMAQHRTRPANLLTPIVLAALAAGGCAGPSEDGGPSGNDLASTIGAAPLDSSDVLGQVPNLDLQPQDPTNKSRRTTRIGYNDLIGNGVVEIRNPSNTAFCSAQVINSTALLTAAHCIDALMMNTVITLDVFFTNRGGTPFRVYHGLAVGVKEPSASRGSRDTAVVIVNGMSTCDGTLSDCKTNLPDLPVNSAFQFFVPGATPAVATSYAILGYGGTDETGADAGFLRAGTMTNVSTAFTPDGNGFSTLVQWTQDDQARPCGGDSGSPLVSGLTFAGRMFYTGQGSLYLNGLAQACTDAAGGNFYSGLTTAQATWVLNVLAANRTAARPFHCASGSQSGINGFVCDNAGKVF